MERKLSRLDERNQEAMVKLNRVLLFWEDGKQYKGFKLKTLTLAIINEARLLFKLLDYYGYADTICSDTKDLLEYCGFEIVEKGIGWRAYL